MSASALVSAGVQATAASGDSGGIAIAYLLAAIVAFGVGYIPARAANAPKGFAIVIGVILAIVVVGGVVAVGG